MGKPVPAPLLTMLQRKGVIGGPTAALFLIVTERDGVTRHLYTTHDVAVPLDGDTYVPSNAFSISAISSDATVRVDDARVLMFFDDNEISEADALSGRYDDATVQILLGDFETPANGSVEIFTGMFGQADQAQEGAMVIELRDLSQWLKTVIGVVVGSHCEVDLGSTVPLAAPSDYGPCLFPIEPDIRLDSTAYAVGDYVRVVTGVGLDVYEERIYECTTAGTTHTSAPAMDTTVGNTTAEASGTCVWTAREAFTITADVDTEAGNGRNFTVPAALLDAARFESGAVFILGQIVWLTGDNEGDASQVKTLADPAVELVAQTRDAIQVGDTFRLSFGCDKMRSTCRDRFAIPDSLDFPNGNAINFQGFPDVPGKDVNFRTPDTR